MPPVHPVFIGGSPRSGTHAVGQLIGSHPDYRVISIEARVHSGRGGLCELLAGKTTLDEFVVRYRGGWWSRPTRRGGFNTVMEKAAYEASLERFVAEWPLGPIDAARGLVHGLLDPLAERAGKPAWVEVTGGNVREAPTLIRLFPQCKVVNMTRDGRAVAASILSRSDMTDDHRRALTAWSGRVRTAAAAIQAVPAERLLSLSLEDLVAHQRDRAFGQLTEFLEIADSAAMHEHFEAELTAERAHIGQWRERVSPEIAGRIERRHARMVARLTEQGIDVPRQAET
jgi:hypothetical protein